MDTYIVVVFFCTIQDVIESVIISIPLFLELFRNHFFYKVMQDISGSYTLGLKIMCTIRKQLMLMGVAYTTSGQGNLTILLTAFVCILGNRSANRFYTHFTKATERYINGKGEQVVCELLKCFGKVIHLGVRGIQPQKHLHRNTEGECLGGGVDINRSRFRTPLGHFLFDYMLQAGDIRLQRNVTERLCKDLRRRQNAKG